MVGSIPRKTALETFGEAFGWVKRNPVLVVLFFILGVIDAAGEAEPLLSLLAVVLTLYFGGIAHLFARDELGGTTPDLGEASSRVLGRLVSLIGIVLVYVVLVFVGLLAFIVPGIYLLLRLSLAFPACVIDDQNAFESLSTSWDVAHGNLLKLLGISVLALLAYSAAALFAVAVAVPFGDEATFFAVVVLASAVATAILQPLVELAYARVYLENRDDDEMYHADDPADDGPASAADDERLGESTWDEDRSGHGWDRSDDSR
ncbi:hypothetical protein [Halovivax gelatinilyticus]|uniref:hypothetical protein n=1 Tax=Halovivax gelatinilyticus TaxID=2961597 RepID=UPI0020CA49F5|nr:hypothetical protein [Halovivax gelatinilyticus]